MSRRMAVRTGGLSGLMVLVVVLSGCTPMSGAEPQYAGVESAAVENASLESALHDRMSTASTAAEPVITIPVYVHVITRGTGVSDGYLSNTTINSQLAVLNTAFAGTPFRFSLLGSDTTLNATWFVAGTNSSAEASMKAALRKGGLNALNLYFNNPDNGSTRGSGTYPWQYASSPKADGVVVLYSSVPGGSAASYNQGYTAVHMVGHWLGLYHTYQGGCTAPGDYVSDTPAQLSPSTACLPSRQEFCSLPSGVNLVANHMDEAADSCGSQFTPGQIARMSAQFNQYRAPLTTTLTAPGNGALLSGNIEITAAASGSCGISRVDFYVGSMLVGTDTVAPYSVLWNSTSVDSGQYSLTSRAFCSTASSTSAPVSIHIDNTSPTVSLTSPQPTGELVLAGPSLKMEATANDAVGVAKVEFYVGTQLVGVDDTSPYEASWPTLFEQSGDYPLTAKAYDAAGNIGTSPSVTVHLYRDTTSPTVSITRPQPTGAEVLIGTPLELEATAGDDVGVTKVEFYVGSDLIGVASTAPYEASWPTLFAQSGYYTFTAKAYDATGNTSTSAPVTVRVHPDETDPVVSLTPPPQAGSTILPGTIVELEATASDNVNVSKVEFYAGPDLIDVVYTPPYKVSWNTLFVLNGTYSLTAKAYDAFGNVGTSASVMISVYIQELTNGIEAYVSHAPGEDPGYFALNDVPAGHELQFIARAANYSHVYGYVYVRFGALPNRNTYDCMGFVWRGSTATCSLSTTQSGRWFVMIDSASSYVSAPLFEAYLSGTI